MQEKRQTSRETLTGEQRAFLHPEIPIASPPALDVDTVAMGSSKFAVVPANHATPKLRAHSSNLYGNTRRSVSLPRRDRYPMQSVTLRLSALVAHGLRQASIERSLEYQEPYTQQAIAEAALSAWLERNGYVVEP